MASTKPEDPQCRPLRPGAAVALLGLIGAAVLFVSTAVAQETEDDIPDLARHMAGSGLYQGNLLSQGLGTCEPERGQSGHDPVQHQCMASIAQMDNVFSGSTLAASSGNDAGDAPIALANGQGSTSSREIYLVESYATTTYAFTFRETLLGFNLPPSDIPRLLPVRIPFALIWNLGGQRAVAYAGLRVSGRSQSIHSPNFIPLAVVNACFSDVGPCGIGSSGASGAAVGAATQYFQIGGPPFELRFDTNTDCGMPHTGAEIRSANCTAQATAAGSAPLPPGSAQGKTAAVAGLPHIDPTFVPPPDWGVPPGADLNDYFRIEFSRNFDPDWVFDDQFE